MHDAIIPQELWDAVQMKPAALEKLAREHLQIVIPCHDEMRDVVLPYQCERVQDGAMVIKPEGKTDIFDLPPKNFKKLIQGIIWRDEYFDGTSLKSIAR